MMTKKIDAQTRNKIQATNAADRSMLEAARCGVALEDEQLDNITGGKFIRNKDDDKKLPNEVNEDDPPCASFKSCWYKGFFKKCKNCYYCQKTGDKYYCTNISALTNNGSNNTKFI